MTPPRLLLLAAALSTGLLRAQPTQLVVDDRRTASGGASGLAAEHPWVPDVQELVGLAEPGPPIRVLLLPESSPQARAAPAWVAGYTDGLSDEVVLFPARTPGYPDGGLEEVLAHEVAHVLVWRASRGGRIPRWFNEGTAMVAGRSWGIRDRTQLAFGLLSGEKVALWRLDELFRGDRTSVERAYALSGELMRDLLERYGPGLPRAVLSRVGRGDRFEEAFRGTTGSTLVDLEETFFARQTFLRRWFPVVTSGTVLWFGISVMALVAALKRRRKRRLELARMEAEELAAEVAFAATTTPPPAEGGKPDDWTIN
jgi:hypothetical protein